MRAIVKSACANITAILLFTGMASAGECDKPDTVAALREIVGCHQLLNCAELGAKELGELPEKFKALSGLSASLVLSALGLPDNFATRGFAELYIRKASQISDVGSVFELANYRTIYVDPVLQRIHCEVTFVADIEKLRPILDWSTLQSIIYLGDDITYTDWFAIKYALKNNAPDARVKLSAEIDDNKYKLRWVSSRIPTKYIIFANDGNPLIQMDLVIHGVVVQ